MQRQNRKRFATLGLAATLVLGAGIAAALTLPDTAAEQAKERTTDLETTNTEGPGIQGDNGSIQSLTASEHGKAVSELAQDDSIEGCEHGRAVSDLASSKADDNRKNEGDHPGPCGPSDGGTTGGAAASAGSNGNHGLSNNGNHGLSNNGNHGQSSNAGAQGSNRGGQGSNAGGNRKNELPHGVETAPGQNSDEQAGTTVVPDDLTTTPTP